MFRRAVLSMSGWTRGLDESGQSTAEYALVILGAAAIATMLITWATGTHTITDLFDTVIGKVLK